ncbi:DUF2798 domain-containing protein [Hansschlegelia plantiphila]|uniref:DUF2798 domain-containing protein n=1 Tax=Hansschlegelia plantiphila TaxID=374655 RepID=A0A9W6J0D7_9HYPH|nr:DUF2798 domain-containing protein [Hansschlegelia plantiphila]GLK68476.1 hypothetical protein GCM10008179_21140 [Hansschlegelia plantiphila]
MSTVRKLPACFNGVVTPFLLSLLMCFIVSGISTGRGIGLAPDLPEQWLRAWGLSWVIAFPTLLVVLPAVRRLAGLIVEQPGK